MEKHSVKAFQDFARYVYNQFGMCIATLCYVTAGTFTRLGLCRLLYDKALVSRVLSISHDE
jgi:hypothetical protein